MIEIRISGEPCVWSKACTWLKDQGNEHIEDYVSMLLGHREFLFKIKDPKTAMLFAMRWS